MKNTRALLIGTFLAALINLWEPFSYYVVHSSWMRFGYVSVAAMLPLVLLAFPVNMLLRWLRPQWAITPSEFVLIFSMAMIAAIFPTLGILGFLFAFTAAPFYFASPENDWYDCLTSHMPTWLVPSGECVESSFVPNAVRWLYEGVPAGQAIPWGAWVPMLFWWSVLIAGVFMTCFCTMVILRRQWVDSERLSFPLARLPLALMAESDKPGILPAFARSKLFWFGFAVPFGIICWNMINYFEPAWPRIPVGQWQSLLLARGFQPLLVKINFFVMCFAFFTPLNVLLSIWFFHLLIIIENGIMNRIGFSLGSPDNWCTFNSATGWQQLGGFIVIVFMGFWLARGHLKGVLRTALGLEGRLDDSGELVRYRTAVIGTLVGMMLVAGWFLHAGMAPLVVFTFLSLVYITYVGVTRLVAQTGLVYLWSPITPHSATFHILGSASMRPTDFAMIGLAYCVGCNVERLIPCTAAHVTYMRNEFYLARRVFLAAVVIAAVVSMVTGVVFTLYMAYTMGASNFNAFEFSRGPHWIFGVIVGKVKNPMPTDWRLITCAGIGAVLMGAVSLLHYRLPWWPIHPVGLAVGGTETAWFGAFSIFLTWLIKLVIVKVGGAALYQRSQSFFVGMLAGYILGVGLSFAVDCIWFMGQGHVIHLW